MEIFSTEIREKFDKYTTHVPISTFSFSIHISLQHGYLYTDTPKVCSTTIKNSLHRLELGDPAFRLENAEQLHERIRSPLLLPCQVGDFDKLIRSHKIFKFCFSRNPYARLLSAYLDKIKPGTFQTKGLIDFLGSEKYSISKQFSFDEFVNIVCDQPISEMNMHWRVQYYQTYQDTISYDFLGKMENFENDFIEVFRRINADHGCFAASERAHSTDASELLSKYYTPQLIKMVEEKFTKDFEFFGYDSATSVTRKVIST
ncbi:sulfotransferase family protein [Microbulbifer taiwanensis]|uniref:Sulfotransferase family protein n=2 Tax=Microbulbifer taiwanensis TaxID=986746 RepID=A0ABW1YLG4_9GAMM|nr:sulfotransferase family protein [Microbulbifer taiwanensis]